MLGVAWKLKWRLQIKLDLILLFERAWCPEHCRSYIHGKKVFIAGFGRVWLKNEQDELLSIFLKHLESFPGHFQHCENRGKTYTICTLTEHLPRFRADGYAQILAVPELRQKT